MQEHSYKNGNCALTICATKGVHLTSFGTTSVQLRERKNGLPAPKRHQMKHLDFLIAFFGTRRSVVQIHSPRPLFLSFPQSFTLLVLPSIFGRFSVHSVQPRATRTRTHTFLPIFCGTPRVVRKNSVWRPSDRDVGTYLFGFAALENPRSQPR